MSRHSYRRSVRAYFTERGLSPALVELLAGDDVWEPQVSSRSMLLLAQHRKYDVESAARFVASLSELWLPKGVGMMTYSFLLRRLNGEAATPR